MKTLSSYPSCLASANEEKCSSKSQYAITVSVDETPSTGAESVEQDDVISSTAAESKTSVSPDNKETISVVPIQLPAQYESPRIECKSWNQWLFAEIINVLERAPDHVALVDETKDRHYITYEELMKNVNRVANFLFHHGIQNGSRVVICMSNSVEFVYFELALLLIGAVPILLNPGHVAYGRIPRFQCTAVVVDNEHYSHVIRSITNFIGAMQVFALSEDIGCLPIPRYAWIIDAFGFREFHSESPWICNSDYQVDEVVAFSSRISESRTHLLVTSGLHTVDAWSLLIYSLVSDRTLIITESNSDVWAVSSLDRIAELIQLYDVALITSYPQFLKSFLKYNLHKLYDISALKVVSYTGSSLPKFVAEQFQEATGASIIQVYSSTECGPISYDLVNFEDVNITSCGTIFEGIKVMVTNDDGETQLPAGEWGQIMLQSSVMCSRYLGGSIAGSWNPNKWFRTGDIGMLDEKKKLHVAGTADTLLKFNDQTVVTVLLENALVANPSIEDVVVVVMNGELIAGVVVREGKEPPTLEELNGFIREKGLTMGPLTKIVQVDFVPRSETGRLIRSEVLFLLESENGNRPLRKIFTVHNKQLDFTSM